jgi:hypothetical protein
MMVTIACEGAVPHVIVKTVRWLMAPVESEPEGKVLTVAGNPGSDGVLAIEQEAGGFATVQESVEESPLRTRVGLAMNEVMEGGVVA